MAKSTIAVMLLAAWLSASPSEAATHYVSIQDPKADDKNPGTAELPLRTIQKAADVVRPGDTVKIRPGRYREGIIVHQCGRLDPEQQRDQERVTFEADGGDVILDGSWRVPDDAWRPLQGTKNVYAAKMDRPAVHLDRGNKGVAVPAPEPHCVHVNEQLLLPHVKPGPGRGCAPAMIDDASVDRWYCDHKASLLYINLGGRRPTTVDVSVRYHAFGGWRPVHYCTFRGLTFQRYSHGAIYGDATETWIEDCLFRHNALAIGGGSGGHVVRCTFLDHDGTVINCGVQTLYAQNLFVRYFQDHYLTRNFYNSCAIKSFASDTYFSIRNNVIVDEGSAPKGYAGCGGIWFDNPSQGNFVYGNTISRAGMGMYIEYPMINALIAWNVVEDVNEGIVLRHNTANTVVENCIRRARARGIKIQDTTRGFVPIVKHNLLAGNYLEDCGVGVVAGPERNSSKQQANFADGNIYHLKPGQAVADWAGEVYDCVEDFRKGAGLEMHGRAGTLSADELDLVTFRVGDSDRPWKVYSMFGNPHLDRIQFNRSEYGQMRCKTFPGLPYFYEPGMGDGSRRAWYNGDHRALWPRNKAVTIDNHPAGLSWYYSSCEPWTAVVTAPTGGGWVGGGVRGYMKVEAALQGRGGGDENGRLQVLSRGPEGAPREGLGWHTVSLPTVPGAVIDIGLWMQAVKVKPVDKAGAGGAVVLVEWSDYTRTKVARTFILGRDDDGKDHLPALVAGDWPDYRRIEGTVTAPQWAKRFRLFMGLRSATGILQLDDIDTIRTRPGHAPPGQEEADIPPAPVHPARLKFEVVDLSKLVNRSLADETADDGRGGWTDEGPQLDMRGIAPGAKTYQNVPYRIGQPLSCVVLRSPTRKAGDLPEAVSIPVGKPAEMLYFLHALAGKPEQEHFRYAVHYEDGNREGIPIIAAKNIRDWTDTGDWLTEPGKWRAFAAESTGGPVHPRQSIWVLEWKNPKPERAIRTVDFVGSGRGVPILLGITLGQKK